MKRIKEKYNVVKIELDIEHDSWFDYYDGSGFYSDYDEYYESNYNYGYVDKEYSKDLITGPIHRRVRYTYKNFPYGVVDMNSIYSKIERRNKLIDEILGNSNPKVVYKPTFADIWKE